MIEWEDISPCDTQEAYRCNIGECEIEIRRFNNGEIYLICFMADLNLCLLDSEGMEEAKEEAVTRVYVELTKKIAEIKQARDILRDAK